MIVAGWWAGGGCGFLGVGVRGGGLVGGVDVFARGGGWGTGGGWRWVAWG